MTAHLSSTTPSRSRAGTREAIVNAALRVFADTGYTRAAMDAIAAAAGVAKPTLYTHFTGKQDLFVAALTHAATRSARAAIDVIRAFPSDPANPDALAAELRTIGDDMVACLLSDESTAVRRLIVAESVRFDDLAGVVRSSGPDDLVDVLAGRLAHLVWRDHLRPLDPLVAARQFVALVTGDLLMRSTLDTTPVPADTCRQIVADGVTTFLAAFGPTSSG